jgi:methylmalonyl-CoA epimerase
VKPPLASVAHIGLAVADLDEALAFYRDVLGISPDEQREVDGARSVALRAGDVDIELLCPMTTDGPVAKFLARRGPGIHHICYRVPDLERALQLCREHGYQLVDQTPRTGRDGHRIAFVHPKSTAGALVELTE